MLLEKIALNYLKYRRRISLRNVDINIPISLLTQFKSEFAPGSESFEKLINNVLQHIGIKKKGVSFASSNEYRQFINALDSKLTIFDNQPFQLGGLDYEIHLISELLYNFSSPLVLEIGVANGYSSAFLYYAIEKNDGRITSIDLPKFPKKTIKPYEVLHIWLAKRGKIENTGTLGDLNPGGVIPNKKYGGWLIPMALRMKVPNITITGNVFNIFQDFPDDYKFDFVVFDAMKDYKLRIKILELIAAHLKPKGLCALDGYWLNSAFDDFCKQNKKPVWKFGRVGLFANS